MEIEGCEAREANHSQPAPGTRRTTAELFPLLYEQMRAIAARRMRGASKGQTLQATALVHEVFVRLKDRDQQWDNERHFMAAAAQAMREILVDRARSKALLKNGGGRRRVKLDEQVFGDAMRTSGEMLIRIDDVLRRLEALDPQKAEIVTLKFFAGLTTAQASLCTGLSERSIERYWDFARAWLLYELSWQANSPKAPDDSTETTKARTAARI